METSEHHGEVSSAHDSNGWLKKDTTDKSHGTNVLFEVGLTSRDEELDRDIISSNLHNNDSRNSSISAGETSLKKNIELASYSRSTSSMGDKSDSLRVLQSNNIEIIDEVEYRSLSQKIPRSVSIDIIRGVGIFGMLVIHQILYNMDWGLDKENAKEKYHFNYDMFAIIFLFIEELNVIFFQCSAFGSGASIIKQLARPGKFSTGCYPYLIVIFKGFLMIYLAYLVQTLLMIIPYRLIWYALGNPYDFAVENNWYTFNLLQMFLSSKSLVIRAVAFNTMVSTLLLIGVLRIFKSHSSRIYALFSLVLINYTIGYLIRYWGSIAAYGNDQTFEDLVFYQESQLYWDGTSPYEFYIDPAYLPSKTSNNHDGCIYFTPRQYIPDHSFFEYQDTYCMALKQGDFTDIEYQKCREAVEKLVTDVEEKLGEDFFVRQVYSSSRLAGIYYPFRVCDLDGDRDGFNCQDLFNDPQYAKYMNSKESKIRTDKYAPWYGTYEYPCKKDNPHVNVEVVKMDNWLVKALPGIGQFEYYEAAILRTTPAQQFVQWIFNTLIGFYPRFCYGFSANLGILLAYLLTIDGWTTLVASAIFYIGAFSFLVLGMPALVIIAITGDYEQGAPESQAFFGGLALLLYSFLAFFMEVRRDYGWVGANEFQKTKLFRFFRRFGTVSFTLYQMQYVIALPFRLLFEIGFGGGKYGYCLQDHMDIFMGIRMHRPDDDCMEPFNKKIPENRLWPEAPLQYVWFLLLFVLVYITFISVALWAWEKVNYLGSIEWISGKLVQYVLKVKSNRLHIETQEKAEEINGITFNKPAPPDIYQFFTAFPIFVKDYFKGVLSQKLSGDGTTRQAKRQKSDASIDLAVLNENEKINIKSTMVDSRSYSDIISDYEDKGDNNTMNP